jgi:hypothetical protein
MTRDETSDVFPLVAAESQVLYRRVNERILELARHSKLVKGLFVCECGRAECSQPLDLSPLEYEAVRSHGARFVVAVGHDDPTFEVAVMRTARYLVVEKKGLGRALALRTDPRARPDPPEAA